MISKILDKAAAGERLSFDEGLLLMERADLASLGRAALAARQRLHPEPVATYVIDRNINYTNICVADCDFCAFYRRPGDPEEYVLPRGELYAKIRELKVVGGTQILMQGGHHPKLTMQWYLDLLSADPLRRME